MPLFSFFLDIVLKTTEVNQDLGNIKGVQRKLGEGGS